jgi:hypothetical protein
LLIVAERHSNTQQDTATHSKTQQDTATPHTGTGTVLPQTPKCNTSVTSLTNQQLNQTRPSCFHKHIPVNTICKLMCHTAAYKCNHVICKTNHIHATHVPRIMSPSGRDMRTLLTMQYVTYKTGISDVPTVQVQRSEHTTVQVQRSEHTTTTNCCNISLF